MDIPPQWCQNHGVSEPINVTGSLGIDATLLIWEQLNCEAVVHLSEFTPDGKPAYLHFKVWRVEGWTNDKGEVWDDDDTGKPVANYRVLNSGGNDQTTTDRAKAGILMQGRIKWDGCSDVQYRPDHYYHYEHYCNRDAAMIPGTIMGCLYNLLGVLRSL